MEHYDFSTPISTVAVFAGSGAKIADVYREHAFELGKLIAEEGWVQANGGGSTGLMAAATSGAKSVDGIVDSVILRRFLGENEHAMFRHQYVYETLSERKAKFIEMSEAIVALPGGFGTLDELFDVVCERQLGINEKAIVVVNTDGFYNGIRQYMAHAIEKGFISPSMAKAVMFANNPAQAVQMLKRFKKVFIDKAAINSGEMNAMGPQDNPTAN